MKRRVVMFAMACVAASAVLSAQQPAQMPASPAGTAATQVGGKYEKNAQGRERYTGGKWIEITYGRPLKRERNLWGSGSDYAKQYILQNNAPVWRAGANVTTRIKTEVPLQIGGKTVPAGEYSLFIDTKSPTDWTLIVSTWGAQEKYDPKNKEALWGSFGYTPDKDVARAPMTVSKMPMSMEQLTWAFVDMTATGGKLAIMWDTVAAAAPFTVAQ
jgi:hypothetical protein